jgi:hypothetical protein
MAANALRPIPARERAGIAELSRIYKEARRGILAELMAVGISGYKDLSALRASDRISRRVRLLDARVRGWTRRQVGAIYNERATALRVPFAVLGLRRRAKRPEEIKRSASERLVEATERDLLRANASILKSASLFLYAARRAASATAKIQAFDEGDLAEILEAFDVELEEALMAGWSRQRLSGILEKRLEAELGEDGLVNINGRNYQIDYYAELVARTRLREAQSDATIDLCGEYGCDLVEFSQHATSCAVCAPFEAQVFSISGESDRYPQLTDAETPPIHPNCRHSITPTTEIAIRFREEYAGGGAP